MSLQTMRTIEDHSDEGSLAEEELFASHSCNDKQCTEDMIVKSSDDAGDRMANALSSYFSLMASERQVICDNLTVVMDNAHIPLSEEVRMADSISSRADLTKSMSAINFVAYPPPFLGKEQSRWESSDFANDANKSDSKLLLPRRSSDEDTKLSPKKRDRRSRNPLGHSPSLDSTVRWLREFPLDLSDHSIRSRRDGALLSPKRQESMTDEEPTRSKKKVYMEAEVYPRMILRQLSEGSHDTSDVHSGYGSVDSIADDISIATDDDSGVVRQDRNPANDDDGISNSRVGDDSKLESSSSKDHISVKGALGEAMGKGTCTVMDFLKKREDAAIMVDRSLAFTNSPHSTGKKVMKLQGGSNLEEVLADLDAIGSYVNES